MEAKDLLEEYLVSGHGACPGCAMPVVMRHAFHALGPRTVSVVTASCYGTIISTYPFSPVKICTYTTPFASAASAASGIKAALDRHGDFQTTVLAVAGDGGDLRHRDPGPFSEQPSGTTISSFSATTTRPT